MFFRIKKVKSYEYLQIIENKRDWTGRARQRVLFTLGNMAKLKESGQIESLAESLDSFREKPAVTNNRQAGEDNTNLL